MSDSTLPKEAITVFGAVVIGVALIGFLRATDRDHYDFGAPVPHNEVTEHEGVPTARAYAEMRSVPRGEGSGFGLALGGLHDNLPSRTDDVSLDGTSKAADLQLRADRRAYDGAPPVIPHPVRQRTQSECVACHEAGLKIGDKQAPMYPHNGFISCTQCHTMAVPNPPWGQGRSAGLETDPRSPVNTFVGLQAPTQGPRWSGISPPAIPHETFMHERCDSCHGVAGKDAMRSTHPQRQNCEQCHVTQVGLEQRPGGAE